jgi:peptide/nickel transport system ATP-binding protein
MEKSVMNIDGEHQGPGESEHGQLLSVSDLSIVYEQKKSTALVLDNINLDLDKNTFVAIVGESGCGKSTLALSIIGLLSIPPAKITGGKIQYKNTNLTALKANARRQYRGTEIAMIFQEPLTSLNPVYKVGDQIAEAIVIREQRKGNQSEDLHSDVMQKTYKVNETEFPSRLPRRRGSGLRKLLETEVIDALKRVRIADPEQVIERYPFELSGGMRQRVMIAMALSQKPALLIADEPTTALDVTTQAQVLKLMKTLMDEVNTSILLITHDLAVASQVADRIIVMYAGEIVEDANVYDLFKEPLHPYSKGLLACIPSSSKDKERLKPIPGFVPSLSNLPVGCKYASRCPNVMDICRKKKPELVEARPGHKVACYLYE